MWDRGSVGDGVRYDGIRYLSRLGGDKECWVVFEGTPLVEVERRAVPAIDHDLCEAARTFELTNH